MNINDDVARWIRTGVTLLIGFLVTWLASTLHIVIGPSSEAGLVALTVPIVSGAYYALARVVEARYPAVGKYLLGAQKAATVTLVPAPAPAPVTPPAASTAPPATPPVPPRTT